MSLVPLARHLVAKKAMDKVARLVPSPSTAVDAPISASPASAPAASGVTAVSPEELEAAVAEAQAELALAAASRAMRHDPYQHVLAGLSGTLGTLPKIVQRWDAAVQAVIAARHPLTTEERADLVRALVEATKDGAYQGTRKEAARMIRRLDHGLAIRMGLWVGAAFVLGSVVTVGAFAYLGSGPYRPDVEAGPVWRELVQNNPDPRPALSAGEVRVDRNTGRHYYSGVSLWLDPSRPPPPSASGKPQGGP